MATFNLNAILNYARTYDEVKDFVGISQPVKANGEINGDWAKIFFTGEGDIITHGVNYTPVFKGAAKGLVPASNYDENDAKLKFLGNNGEWKELTVAELPIAPSYSIGADETEGPKYIYNARQVYEHFHEQIAAVDAMKFKGGFDPNNTTGFPKDGICEKGDTYRVTQSGTYAGYKLMPGDLLICIKEADNVTADDVDGFDGNTGEAIGEYWMVVEANINGFTQHKINNTGFRVYTPDVDSKFNIFAPVTGGNQGEVLISQGDNAPIWADPKYTDFLSNDLKDSIISSISVEPSGIIKWYDLLGNEQGKYTPAVGVDDWTISITGLSAGTKKSLSLAEGLAYESNNATFNGSADEKIQLLPATKSTIGGVKIDPRTNIAAELTAPEFANVSTISVKENGEIYLTYENICNALGFEPGKVSSVHNYGIVLGQKDDKKQSTTLNVSNPFINLTSVDEYNFQTIAGQVQIIGNSSLKATGTIVNSTDKAILLELQAAHTDYLGGIKVFRNHTNDLVAAPQITSTAQHDTNNKYYGIELDNTGKAFVYVPWEDVGNAFSNITVIGGGDGVANGVNGSIKADAVESTFSLIAGNGINLVAHETNKTITINQNVWEVVTNDRMGYAPAMNGSASSPEMTQDYFILSYVGDARNPSWNKLPSGAFKDTWRAIQVNGTELVGTTAIDATGRIVGAPINFTNTNIDGKTNHVQLTPIAPTQDNNISALNIFASWRPIVVGGSAEANVPGAEVHDNHTVSFVNSNDLVVADKVVASKNTHEISFELSWYNISEDVRETAY